MANRTKADLRAFVVKWLSEKASRANIPLPSLGDDTHLFDSKLIDSFDFLDLITAIEDEFGISVDFSELAPEAFLTFGGLLAQCGRELG